MRIQDNLCNTSFRSLHFAKYKPIFNKKLTYAQDTKIEGMKISEKGIKYIEDINIPENLKKEISNSPLIKNLANKFETFIVYTEGLNSAVTDKFFSLLSIYHMEPPRLNSIEKEIIGCDENNYFNARKKCISQLNKD